MTAYVHVASAAADWEASGGGGSLASFAIAGNRVSDLVVQAPVRCANAFGSPPAVQTVVVGGGTLRGGVLHVAGNGAVLSGHVTGGRLALSYRYRQVTPNRYEGTNEVCTAGPIAMKASPSHRRALRDGVYAGHGDGRPFRLTLVAGGRAIAQQGSRSPFTVGLQGSKDNCAYTVSDALFVGPSGSFNNYVDQLGDDATITGQFTSSGVSGTFSYLAEGCGKSPWSASLSK